MQGNYYKYNNTEIFSHPIVNMDWESQNKLKADTEKI